MNYMHYAKRIFLGLIMMVGVLGSILLFVNFFPELTRLIGGSVMVLGLILCVCVLGYSFGDDLIKKLDRKVGNKKEAET